MAETRCMGCMECYDESFKVCPHCGYVQGTPAKEAYHLTPGSYLQGKYQVGRVLGYGGFGVTYIGYDNLLRQKVAIKEYLPGEFATRSAGTAAVTIFTGDKEEQFLGGIRKFSDEAQRLAKMDNVPGVVRIYDTFSENNTAYIVMEYLDGENLKQRLEREGKIPVEEAVQIIIPVLEALEGVHSTGMLHRDVSPDNIFLTKKGEVKLLDFGAARYATTTHSRSLSVVVKQGFAPEEQYRSRGNQGPWTDVYACGATLYKMITGVTPEDAMERKEKDELIPPSKMGIKIDSNTETAIMNAMNILGEDRTQSAAAFKEELLAESKVKRRAGKWKLPDVGRWPKWVKIASATAAAAVVTVLVLALTGVIKFTSKEEVDVTIGQDQLYMIQTTGQSVESARQALLDVGLSADTADGVYSKTRAGWVYEQSVPKGMIVEKGTLITLTFSKGVEQETLEELSGMTREEAEAWLTEHGFKASVEEIPSSAEPNSVVRTEPEAGDIDKGSEVKLFISKGLENLDPTKETTVPDVVGKTKEEGEKLATDAGMYYKTKTAVSDTVPEGQIISQNPQGGAKAHQADTLEVVVSEGKNKKVKVPSIMYEKKATAASKLSAKNLKPSYKYQDSEYPDDTVIGVSPSVGSSVNEGDTITVTLSKYVGSATANTGESSSTQKSTASTEKKTTTTEKKTTEKNSSATTEKKTEQKTTEKKTTEKKTTEKKTEEASSEIPIGTVSVPNVVNKTASDASAILSNSGLSMGSVVYEKTTDKSKDGKVISQDPSSGSSVKKGSTVTVFVGQYSDDQVTVPDLTRYTKSQAKSILEGEGLKLGSSVTYYHSKSKADGDILDYSPKGKVDKGTTIQISVVDNSKKTQYSISEAVSTETITTKSSNSPGDDSDTIEYFLESGSPKTVDGEKVWYWKKVTWGAWSDYGDTQYSEVAMKRRVRNKTVYKYPEY